MLLSGLAATFSLALLFFQHERFERQRALEDEANARWSALNSGVMRSMEVLRSIASYFAARGEITRSEFHAFVSAAIDRQPELQGLTWDPRVSDAEREEWEERTRVEGFPNFQFTEDQGNHTLVRAGRRPEYFPVYYLEPYLRNGVAMGYDTASEPERALALQAARDSGEARASGPVRLEQETGAQKGLLVFQPIYRGAAASVLERRKSLLGFAVAVYRIGDLAEAALKRGSSGRFRSFLFEDSDQSLLYSSSGGKFDPHAACAVRQVNMSGRSWKLLVQERNTRRGLGFPSQSIVALISGLAVTLLLAVHLDHSLKRAEEIEQKVQEATRDLSAEIAERKKVELDLERARDELEARVEQRTAELARTNEALVSEIAIRKEAEANAEAASTAKSRFLANMSHEIRTPMNAILGYAQILFRDASLDAFHRDAVATIASSSDHLLRMIDEILDLSKIDAGRMELVPQSFDLFELGRELAVLFQRACEEKGLGLRLEGFEGWPPCIVHGDAGKLRQVLINLVGNAVKFTTAGSVELRLEQMANHTYRFLVKDTGPGIPPEIQHLVFEPFQQGPAADGLGGTGLGLTIARRQVELMGGALELHSSLGQGACFSFVVSLPSAPQQLALPRESLASVSHLASGQSFNVIVVDPIRENRDVLGRMLGSIGCEVRLCSALTEAEKEMALKLPSILFLDLRRPEPEEVEPLRSLIERYGPKDVKVVATSASVLDHEREVFMRAGCDDFLPKPFRCERVFGCLRNLLDATFVYREEEAPVSRPESMDLQTVRLPEDLALRLMMAAELHSATVLKTCLAELQRIGPAEDRLAAHLRHFLASYDMETIQKIIAQAPVARITQAVHTGGHGNQERPAANHGSAEINLRS